MALAVGDKVRLKESRAGTVWQKGLRVGPAYEVKGLFYGCVDLAGVSGHVSPSRLEKIEEPALKVGDRVRFVEPYLDHGVGTEATVIEDERIIAGDPHVRLKTADGRLPWPLAKRVEKIEEPKFKVGDRVRITRSRFGGDVWVGFEAIVLPRYAGASALHNSKTWLRPIGKRPWGTGDFWWPTDCLEKVESVPFELEYGDKVVNRKTGRVGRVLLGPVSKELKVYDEKPSMQAPDAPTARALEEYEEHFPGTYDLFKAKDNPWQ